ncbi:MAG: carbohydrate ABC transporter permease, partial [Candidatus Roseilinea sp.]|uniref:carbohydrate ABC transporter permease n=1 Tax=Candidatus Roseilinea sp. TaxID=2838777 RepID=UPI004049A9D4
MASSAGTVPGASLDSTTSHHTIKQGFFSRTLPFWLVLPTLLVLLAIQVVPGLFSFFLSTQTFERGEQIFVGLRNFERVFSSSAFNASLFHTLFFLVGYVTLTLIAGFVIAQILNRKLRLSPLYITVIFVPWVLSDVVVGLIFRLFIVPDYGLFSAFFANPAIFPPKGVSILTTPAAPAIISGVPFPPAPALIYLIFASAWKALPFTTMLILAALQTVSRDVIESASIDVADR